MLKRLLREPLVHFLILGGLVFLLFNAAAKPDAPQDGRIVVTGGRIEQLAVAYVRTWQLAPSAEELDGLIEDYVRDEVLSTAPRPSAPVPGGVATTPRHRTRPEPRRKSPGFLKDFASKEAACRVSRWWSIATVRRAIKERLRPPPSRDTRRFPAIGRRRELASAPCLPGDTLRRPMAVTVPSAPVRRGVEALASGVPADVVGLSGSARGKLARSLLQADPSRWLLVVTAGEEEDEALAQDLGFFLGALAPAGTPVVVRVPADPVL